MKLTASTLLTLAVIISNTAMLVHVLRPTRLPADGAVLNGGTWYETRSPIDAPEGASCWAYVSEKGTFGGPVCFFPENGGR